MLDTSGTAFDSSYDIRIHYAVSTKSDLNDKYISCRLSLRRIPNVSECYV